MLDSMTRGRIAALFLRGTPNEHHTYDTVGDTRGMAQKDIDLILKAWREYESFAWEGSIIASRPFPSDRGAVQVPHPLVFGSDNLEESIAFAAAHRLGSAFSFAPLDVGDCWIRLDLTGSAPDPRGGGGDPTVFRRTHRCDLR